MEEEGLEDLVMCGGVRKTEGRHMQNGAWWRISTKTLSFNVRPRAGDQSVCKAASIPFTVYNIRDGSMQNENITSPTLRLCVLDIYHRTWPEFLAAFQDFQDFQAWKWEQPRIRNEANRFLISNSISFFHCVLFQETFPNEFTSGDGKPG